MIITIIYFIQYLIFYVFNIKLFLIFFSQFCKKYGNPAEESSITLGQIDNWLDKLTKVTKEDDQLAVWEEILPLCTPDDLRMLWRIVDHDLSILYFIFIIINHRF